MSEQRTEQRVYKVEYVCDACGEGRMKSTGEATLTSPRSFHHKCDTCGHKQSFRKVSYPHLVYEEARAGREDVGEEPALAVLRCGEPTPLGELDTGLFVFHDTLCLKTEYGGESYIVTSGEVFVGGVRDQRDRNGLLVRPVFVHDAGREGGE